MSQKKISKEYKEIIGPAEAYERDKVPSLFRPLAVKFLEHIPIQNSDTVLDIACGTGILARLIAERSGFSGVVDGVDIDPEMIAVAREQVNPYTAITWHVGSAEDMPFINDETYDWVLCQQGFQYFSDKSRSLREAHRVLKANGNLALMIAQAVSPENQPYQWAKVEAYRKHVSFNAGEKHRTIVPFYDGDEVDLHALISNAGFKDIEIQNIVLERYRGKPEDFIVEQDYSDLERDTRSDVVSDIRKAMKPYQTKDGTAVPYRFHLALGKK